MTFQAETLPKGYSDCVYRLPRHGGALCVFGWRETARGAKRLRIRQFLLRDRDGDRGWTGAGPGDPEHGRNTQLAFGLLARDNRS